MKQPVCDLCGGNEFVKEDGMFVCQGCGTKYSPEEAKNLMKEVPENNLEAAGAAMAGSFSQMFSALKTVSDAVEEAGTFNPAKCLDTIKDPCEINNYICNGWTKTIAEYKATENPSENQQQALVEQSKACLAALDAAGKLVAETPAQAALVYDNCKEIVESVKRTYFFTQNEDGSWKRNNLPFNTDFKLAGQTESWDAKYDRFEAILRQEYVAANPEEAAQRAQLEAQAAQLEAELSNLKSEKKSHGFFDFSGKREVKERMAPVKEELGGVRRQINAIDDHAEDYAEQCIDSQSATFTRLDL